MKRWVYKFVLISAGVLLCQDAATLALGSFSAGEARGQDQYVASSFGGR